MVIHDLFDFRLLQAFHRLGNLIVVHQNHPLLLCFQQVLAGDHAEVAVLAVKNREGTVADIGHGPSNVVDIVRHSEGNDVVPEHEVFDGNTFIEQAGGDKSVIGGAQHDAAPFLCHTENLFICLISHADDQAAGLHLHSAELGLVAVADNNHIARLNIILHQIGIGRRNQNLAGRCAPFDFPGQKPGFQGLNDIAVRGFCIRQDAAVLHAHNGLCDIADGDQTFQGSVFSGYCKCGKVFLAQDFPGSADGKVSADDFTLLDRQITDLKAYVFQIFRRFMAEGAQDAGGLPVHVPDPAGLVAV